MTRIYLSMSLQALAFAQAFHPITV